MEQTVRRFLDGSVYAAWTSGNYYGAASYDNLTTPGCRPSSPLDNLLLPA
jgi:hypothetical protein